ncbi:ATP-dependent DNA helicase [Trichonephila clavipes]|nr:ATP-dependent DNA helicase [Trichonephila clavipes]
MYAKIETKRLLYIRLNQTELRSEQYIHLRDAIVNDGNVNPNELGRMAILPDALGRLYTVHPNNTECFYLRLLLINIRGPISFQDLRTVNGQLCATYRQACQELNLLENDAHWDTALDASNTDRPQQIRTLFAIILTTWFPSNPKHLWEKYKDYMSEDILHRLRATNQNSDIQFTPNVYNEALILIEDICLTIANKALVQLGMPASNRPEKQPF